MTKKQQKVLFFIIAAILTIAATLVRRCSSGEQIVTPYSGSVVYIGTFNIEWFGDGNNDRNPRSQDDVKRLADVIKDSKADVLGVQEVENDGALQRLLQFLPDYTGMIFKSGSQNVGVIHKKSIAVQSLGEYAPVAIIKGRNRPGLLLQCKAGNFDWLMMVVHFKSTSRYDDTEEKRDNAIETRLKQSSAVRQWADSVIAIGKERDIIVVGDFNDSPNNKETALIPMLQDKNLTFLTTNLVSCKNPKWKVIDHIVVSSDALRRTQIGSILVTNQHQRYGKDLSDKISDHCPIVVPFDVMAQDND
jgi:endonuclease/exonuclease/phosphatase family metal-dependent hydrolase